MPKTNLYSNLTDKSLNLVLKKLLISFFALLLCEISFSQPDLTLTSFTVIPSTVKRGDLFKANITVKNIGNKTADTSFIMLCLNTNAEMRMSGSDTITRASVKPLASGESVNIEFACVMSTFIKGIYAPIAFIDCYNDIIEIDENNNIYRAGTNTNQNITVIEGTNNEKKIPYPILFVHGWNSNSNTWNSLTNKIDVELGWVFGGRFDFCLNQDNDDTKCSGLSDIKDWTNYNNINLGDYYYLNFDVSNEGEIFADDDYKPFVFNDDRSNQAAIVKQGISVGKAIQKILATTRSEKVILVGHSMGGLASREYLQNKSNWQTDGNHHVAKLLTIGTPNGGSNALASAFGNLFGMDMSSEAVRDFRYNAEGHPGVFLDGGTEPTGNQYRNNDINCNSVARDQIEGLNKKLCQTNVQYSCIVGDLYWQGVGDGVVAIDRANLNNYGLKVQSPLEKPVANIFYINNEHRKVHKDMPTFLRGIDEPKTYDLAYGLELEELYFGNVTIQSENDPFPLPYKNYDFDDYKFTIPQNGNVRVRVWNIPVHNFNVYIVDSRNNVLFTFPSGGGSNIDKTMTLPAGTYYLEIGAYPTQLSYRFPYAYAVNFVPTVGPSAAFSLAQQSGCAPFAINFSDISSGSPTSWQWTFQGGTPTTSTLRNPSVTYNNSGVYNVSLSVKNALGVTSTINRNAFIVIGKQPTGDFTHSTNGLSVSFNNQTSINGSYSTFLWDFGDGTTSNAENPIHSYRIAGSYNVLLTVTNGCGTLKVPKIVKLQSTPTLDIDGKNTVLLYPNPAKDRFTIETIQNTDINYFAVSDIYGRKYFSDYINHKYTDIDTHDYPNGMYIVVLYAKGIQVGSLKMIIQK